MLSWDDYSNDTSVDTSTLSTSKSSALEQTPAQSVEQKAPEVPASVVSNTLNNLNQAATTPIQKETMQEEVAPKEAASVKLDPIAQAKDSIAKMDIAPGLEELEMGAARIQVDDKRMIN